MSEYQKSFLFLVIFSLLVAVLYHNRNFISPLTSEISRAQEEAKNLYVVRAQKADSDSSSVTESTNAQQPAKKEIVSPAKKDQKQLSAEVTFLQITLPDEEKFKNLKKENPELALSELKKWNDQQIIILQLARGSQINSQSETHINEQNLFHAYAHCAQNKAYGLTTIKAFCLVAARVLSTADEELTHEYTKLEESMDDNILQIAKSIRVINDTSYQRK